MQTVTPILTPEQTEALQAYGNVYPLHTEADTVQRARELINDILAKRDELAELLGLNEIDVKMNVFDIRNHNCDIDTASYIVAQAVELEENDGILNYMSCELRLGKRTDINNYDRQFEMCIRHKK